MDFFVTAPKESMMAEEIKFTVFYNEWLLFVLLNLIVLVPFCKQM